MEADSSAGDSPSDTSPSDLTRVTPSPRPDGSSRDQQPVSAGSSVADRHAPSSTEFLAADGLIQAKTVIRQVGSSEARKDRTPSAGTSGRTPAEIASVLVGQQLNQYSLQELVGGGGMGAVFRAHDQTLDRKVALKVIPFVGNDPELQRRFRNEAQNAAKLDHPRIARIFDAGSHEDWHYIVFEYIEGINLRDRIRAMGVLTLEEAIAYTAQVAEALQHADQRGIVHRDIKPSNVLVSDDGSIKLVDMGLARSDNLDLGEEMTASGVTLGTFDYISPEQAFDPRDADIRSDIYSLGCTLFFMLTGQPPYTGGTMLQKLISHGKTPPPDPREQRPDLPDELVAVMNRMMAKDANSRYQNAADLLADLNELSHRYGLKVPIPGAVVTYAPANEGLHRLQYHLPWMVALVLLLMVGGFLELQAMATRDSFVVPRPTSDAAVAMIPRGFENVNAEATESEVVDSSATNRQGAATLSPDEIKTNSTDPDRIADAARPPRFGESFPLPPNLLSESSAVPYDSAAGPVGTSSSMSGQDAGVQDLNAADPASLSESETDSLKEPTIKQSPALPSPDAVRIVTSGLLALSEKVEGVDRDTDGAILVSTLADAMELAMRFGVNRIEFATPEIVTGPIAIPQDNMIFESTVGRTSIQLVSSDLPTMDKSVMVRIGSYRIQFRNLDFQWEVASDQVDGGAMFEINDNRLTQFRDCTFTLKNTALHERVSFFDVITDPDTLPESETLPGRLFNPSANALPLVAMRFDNAVARGEASLIRMDYAAALQLVWNNGLLALNGRLLETGGALQRPSRLDSPIQLLLSDVTAEVPLGVVQMRLGPRGAFAVPVERQASRCVFLVNPGTPHFEFIGTQSASSEPLELRGEDNAYVCSPSLTDPVLVIDRLEGGSTQVPMSLLAEEGRLDWAQERRPRWSVRWTNPRQSTPFYHDLDPAAYRQDGAIFFGFRELNLPTL
ncbi:MAG: serine/threonine-protein kinase [Planctomycetota bacterium]